MKKLYTIGFTQKSAENFINLIKESGAKRIIDIRLHANTQLAGFAKQNNLEYFLKELSNCNYCHIPLMAPSKEIFDDYKKHGLEWHEYERRFKKLINQRKIEWLIDQKDIDGACLLCCEAEATNCHRRLVAEHLQQYFGDIEIIHL